MPSGHDTSSGCSHCNNNTHTARTPHARRNTQEAVKQLDAQLDSPHFLHQLDAETAKLWPQDRLQRERGAAAVSGEPARLQHCATHEHAAPTLPRPAPPHNTVLTWPGLVDTYLAYVHKEVVTER
jgi:hypothetical protein